MLSMLRPALTQHCYKDTTVHVVQHLAPGGIETLVLELLNHTRHNPKTFVISLEGNLEQAVAQWPRLKPFRSRLLFMNKKPGCQVQLLEQLYRVFKILKPYTVHTHHIGPLLYGGIAGRLASTPICIHTEHDAWHLASQKRRKVQSLALNLVRPKVVADAEFVSEQLKKLFPHLDPHVIKNGIDINKFVPGDKCSARAILGLPSNKTLVGSAGRLESVKGHKYLINAISRVDANVHLVIAGDGSQAETLSLLTKQLNIQHRVHFIGLCRDMPSFYQAIDLFCLPSLYEGFPLSPLEAQACNTPALVTDVGAARETLCPHSGGIVDAGKTFALQHKIEMMLKAPKKAIAPRDFVLNNNSLESMSYAYRALSYRA